LRYGYVELFLEVDDVLFPGVGACGRILCFRDGVVCSFNDFAVVLVEEVVEGHGFY
jgi:hypothetical protein